MAYKVKLTYLDGQVEEVMPTPLARIKAERHYGGLSQANVQEATIYMAWAHLQKAGQVTVDFEQWLESLANAEEIEVADVPPTPPTPSPATSSDSPSEPASPSMS